MRVALINPRVESFSSILPPLGLLYIGAVLEKKHSVRIFDPYPHDDKVFDEILRFQPDIVGISVLTSYLKRANFIISGLKEKLPFTFFVAGGIHPTALPDSSLDYLGVDCLVLGEGEETLSEICEKIERKERWQDVKGIAYKSNSKGLILTGPRPLIEDLDKIPFPARHLINFKRYLFPPGIIRGVWSEKSTTLITSRGCPYQCIWCGSSVLFGRKVRRRSVSNVIDEIEKLISEYNIDTIWFIDDTFTLNKQWVMNFTKELYSRRIRLKWGCQARVDTIDLEMLTAMRKSGAIQLDIGVESGSALVLKAIKKETNPRMIKEAFKIIKKSGLRTMASFMIGNPGETMEDINQTLTLAQAIKPNYVSFYFTTPFPGTELMTMAKENGWIKELDYEKAGLKKYPMMEINFTRKTLMSIRAYLQNKFIWNNYFGMIRQPGYFLNIIKCAIFYPKGLLVAFKAFIKTKVFDDFIFTFLLYYAEQKQK